jgi:hypothetical protein
MSNEKELIWVEKEFAEIGAPICELLGIEYADIAEDAHDRAVDGIATIRQAIAEIEEGDEGMTETGLGV